MVAFTLYTEETAPVDSKPILAAGKKNWGMVPNLHAVLAESPIAFETHNYLFDAFMATSFTDQEKQIILMSVSYENNCHYCMAGHSFLAKRAGVADDVYQAIRDGRPIADAKLEALHAFASEVTAQKGHIADATADAFIAAGYTKAQMLELLMAVALKVMASYTNHFAGTPYDAFQAETKWTHPSAR